MFVDRILRCNYKRHLRGGGSSTAGEPVEPQTAPREGCKDFDSSVSRGVHIHVRTIFFPFAEFDYPIHQSEERVVFAHPYINARMMLSTPLPYDNISGDSLLASENLNTKSLTC